MDRGPLVNEEIDDGSTLAREFNTFAPVKVAFWVKSSEEDQRYLYLASDEINDSNFDVAYGEVIRLTNDLDLPYLDPFRVKVVSSNDPLAVAAAELNSKYSGSIATRYGGRVFGGLNVDDVYIYPRALPIAA